MNSDDRLSYNGLSFQPFLMRSRIEERIKELALQISTDYDGRCPLLLCVLNGAFMFATDLFRELSIDAEISFLKLKSYENTKSTGHVKEVIGLGPEVEGREIIIVEDIIDTGRTMEFILNDLARLSPRSVTIATFLFKPEALVRKINPEYVGFEIPNKFVIGYGLDIDGKARNLPDLWTLSE
ncbi:MAG: hypoxanthine phosphoribosyltransferase [Bacteroidales bacterium]|nr:hypoxanthine phosphoribosyltransferase [Bacteroidales bacterium]